MRKTQFAALVAVLTLGVMAMSPAASAGDGITSHVVSCYSGSTTSRVSFQAPATGQYRFRWAFYNGSTRIYLSNWNFYVPSLWATQSAAKSFTLSHPAQRVTRVLGVVISDYYGT